MSLFSPQKEDFKNILLALAKTPLGKKALFLTEEDEFIRIKQAACLLKCHPNTIRNKMNNGTLPFYREGRRILLLKSDVLKLVG